MSLEFPLAASHAQRAKLSYLPTNVISESQSTRQSKEYRANSDTARPCRVVTQTEPCHFGRCPYGAALLAHAASNTRSPVAQLRAGPGTQLLTCSWGAILNVPCESGLESLWRFAVVRPYNSKLLVPPGNDFLSTMNCIEIIFTGRVRAFIYLFYTAFLRIPTL